MICFKRLNNALYYFKHAFSIFGCMLVERSEDESGIVKKRKKKILAVENVFFYFGSKRK